LRWSFGADPPPGLGSPGLVFSFQPYFYFYSALAHRVLVSLFFSNHCQDQRALARLNGALSLVVIVDYVHFAHCRLTALSRLRSFLNIRSDEGGLEEEKKNQYDKSKAKLCIIFFLLVKNMCKINQPIILLKQ
jgi:hypothetical protein